MICWMCRLLMMQTSLPAPALAEAAHALTAQGTGVWHHDTNVWTYQLPGSALARGWQDVDGTWYLFNDAGAMLTGWQKVGDTYYYLGSSGGMYSARWLLEGETWYYLLPSGEMARNAWTPDGSYVGPDGRWLA